MSGEPRKEGRVRKNFGWGVVRIFFWVVLLNAPIDAVTLNGLSADMYKEYPTPQRLRIGFDALGEDHLKPEHGLEKTLQNGPKLQRGTQPQNVDIYQSLDRVLNFLKNQAEDVPDVSAPNRWTFGTFEDADRLIEKIQLQEDIIDQADQEIESIKVKATDYIKALTKTNDQKRSSLVSRARRNIGLGQALRRAPAPDAHPEVKRFSKSLNLTPGYQSFWDYIKMIIDRVFKLGKGDHTTPSAARLANKMRQTRNFDDVKHEIALEEMYIEGMWRGEFSKQEYDLLQSLDRNPVKLSEPQQKMVDDLNESFYIRRIPKEAFKKARKEYLDGIQNIQLNREEQIRLFVLEHLEVKKRTRFQDDELIQLQARQSIKQRLTETLWKLEQVGRKTNQGIDFTPEEHEFLVSTFQEELNAMRKEVGASGKQKILEHTTHLHWTSIPNGRVQSLKTSDKYVSSPSGNFLSKVLNNEEQKLLHLPNDLLELPKKPSDYHMNPLDREVLSRYLESPPSLVHLIEQSAPIEILQMGQEMGESQILKTLQGKLRARAERRLSLWDSERLAGQSILKLEHKRLNDLTPQEKARDMLEIMTKNGLYHPSIKEEILLSKLDSHAQLDPEEENLLDKLAKQYQTVIINTMSENDVVLSHLLWLEESGTDLRKLMLKAGTQDETVEASRIKMQLWAFADSPLEKYILFKSVETSADHTLEAMALHQLEQIPAKVGERSEVQDQIYSRLQQPLWKRTPETDVQTKVMKELCLSGIKSEIKLQRPERNTSEFIAKGHLDGFHLFEYLTPEESKMLKNLRKKILRTDKNSDEFGSLRSQAFSIVQSGDKRAEFFTDLNHRRNQILFNQNRIHEQIAELEKLKTEFSDEASQIKGKMKALDEWVQSHKN